MGKTHLSGPVVETGTVNSQQTARDSVRSIAYDVHPVISASAVGGNLFERNATMTAENSGAHNWHVSRTAAAADHDPAFEMVITPPFKMIGAADSTRNENTRGFRFTRCDVVYTITTAVADAIAPTFDRISYADGAAVSANTDIPVT